MCGIAGIVSPGRAAPPVDAGELLTMREAMAARGPDGAGIWLAPDGRIGLAHRRLAIIDLSRAADQPMQLPGRDIRIVFGGEILNYRTLRDELIAQGRAFRTASDTEVLLHLYDRDGERMVERLRGLYAFAIWDGERRTLLAARDPFGIVPFYYSVHGGTFRFASQVKALAKGGGLPLDRSMAGTVGFHLFGYVPEPFTIIDAIQALPAGSTLTLSDSGVPVIRRHFDVAAELAEASERNDDPEELRGLIHDALKDALARALTADVPVGLFLSAGRDSNALLALACEQSPANVRTITIGFEEMRGRIEDETGLAGLSAARYGTRHVTRWFDRASFEDSHDALMAAMDQPSFDGVNSFLVSRSAAEAGLKVALSGIGGDELFGGYPSFRQIPCLVRLLGPLRPLRGLGRGLRRAGAPVIGRVRSPKYASLLEYGTSYEDAYLLRRALFLPWELPQLLGPELFAAGWAELDPLGRMADQLRPLGSGDARGYAKVTALELCWYMRNQLLRDTDWAGLSHSIEVRPPFLDVALFRALAPLILGTHPPTKDDVMLGLTDPPPALTMERPKSGFLVPMGNWLERAGPGAAPSRGLRQWALHVFEHWRPDS